MKDMGVLPIPKSFPDQHKAACSGAERTGTLTTHIVLWDRAAGKHCIEQKRNRVRMKLAKYNNPNQNTVKIAVLSNY